MINYSTRLALYGLLFVCLLLLGVREASGDVGTTTKSAETHAGENLQDPTRLRGQLLEKVVTSIPPVTAKAPKEDPVLELVQGLRLKAIVLGSRQTGTALVYGKDKTRYSLRLQSGPRGNAPTFLMEAIPFAVTGFSSNSVTLQHVPSRRAFTVR